ncbi:DDE-domain-containing protein [Choiromyces venosus 120613-1]|uniref:DDE-domain-containing protein n=1 Tax=Choiromyces venosus 120613-1 TaxID=1336337 RepID=A0A3N4IYN5_9PEZI|nr:DDE-domain-containing protein [Choiromyces venosus 120613-1]
MPPIRSPKRRRGPKAKPICERNLTQQELKPIQYPERTYSQSQKLRVLVFLEHHQIPLQRPGEYRRPTQQEASDTYQVPQRTISDWTRKKDKIEQIGKDSPVKKAAALEDQLYNDFLERREARRTVRQAWFRIQSQFRFREIYPNVNPAIFRFSNGWFRGFLGRHKISLRCITKKAQKMPEDYRILVVNWLRFNRWNSQPAAGSFWDVAIDHPVGRYDLSNICNLDETPIPFEYLQGKTYNTVGARTVWAKESRSGWDKQQATLVLCIFADGIPQIPPMIIFHGTGQRVESEKLQYHAGVIVEFNPTAYMNDGLFERYITNYLIPVLGGRPTLFALDLMGSHKTPTVLDILRKNNITPSLIPGGCTSLVQPLDVSVNKPFKDLIRDLTDERIFELESTEEFERWTVRDRCIMITHCVGDAFYKFHSEKASIICTSFRKVSLSLPVDGSLDGELDIKGFTGLEIGNWRQDLGSVDDSADVRSEEDHEVEFVSGFE